MNAIENSIKEHDFNYIIEEFKSAMLNHGIAPPDEIIGDGTLHRFKIGDKLNGAYVLHTDGRPAGYFEDFKQGIRRTWKLSVNYAPLTQAERQAFAIERNKQAVQRQVEETAKHGAAANRAAYLWSIATPAPADHTYLVRKRIHPHGARLGRNNTLIIPIYSANRELVNLQFISEDGIKRFLSGGLKKGCFCPIGNIHKTDKLLICEGFATGASLFEDSGCAVVVAFDAGNLRNVAIVIRSLVSGTEIVIAGDNDSTGIGQAKAIEASLSIKCKYIIPPIAGHDFNDMLNMECV